MNIGITGHQKIGSANVIKWVESEIIKEIEVLNNISEAYSSLAIGADQIFANIALQMHLKLIAIVPCDNYQDTFKSSNKEEYKYLLSKCNQVEKLDFLYPSEEAFYAAGKYIVQKVDLLFAVWNGMPAQGLGGTGDIVKYAHSLNKRIIHLNPISKTKFTHYGA